MISTVRSVNISITSQNYDSFLCVWSTLERFTLAWRAGRWRHPGGGLEIRSAWSWHLGQQGGAWLTLGGSALGAAGSQSDITGAAVHKAHSWRSGNPHPALRLEMNINISHPSIFHLERESIESLTEKSTCISFGEASV